MRIAAERLPLPSPLSEDWIPIGRAALRLGRSGQRVRDLVDRGQLAAVRTPYGRLVSAQAIDELLERRAARSGAK